MGGGASASLESSNMDDDVDENAWLVLQIMTDDGVAFNSRKLFIAGISDSSLLESKEDKIVNRGFWWEHDHVPTEKDDEDNLNEVLIMTTKKQNALVDILKQGGLESSYSEHFACPGEIRPGTVFISARLAYQKPKQKNVSITSVSGILSQDELQVAFVGCQDKSTRGAWLNRARDLLPGQRFEPVHLEIKAWWSRVERLCEAASMSNELHSRRAEYFSMATKRSQAYASAVQCGMGSTKGKEHMTMVETWKEEGEKALLKVSHCFLDKLFDEGKVLVAEVVKDKAVAFEKLDCLKRLLHDEFMESLLGLGDQIESHEHDAWASFHLRFSHERRQSTSVQPRRGRKQSVLLIKEKLLAFQPPPPDKNRSRRSILVTNALLGTSRKSIMEESESEPPSSPFSSSHRESSSPSARRKKSPTRIGLSPLEDDTDKVIEDRVKSMIINMTASATENTTKSKLTKRLALVKSNKTKQRNESFVIGATAHFECLLFDLCINAKMLDYMEREKAVLENKLMNQITTVKKAQSIKHSKDLGQAIKNNAADKEILALEVDLHKRKEKLHNRLNHRKMRKRKEFDDAKANTIDKLKEKLEGINQESTTAYLTKTGVAKVKGISLIYKTLQEAVE